MPEQIPFIGRENELSQIEQLIREWGTRRVLYIQGDGGVGKTRLLEEIRCRYAGDEETRLLVADIIDFDDRTFHVPENVERQIIQRLGEKAFGPYSQKLLDWHRMRLAGVSAEELEEQSKQVRQTMVDSFNRISSARRIVLLLDTIEKLEGTQARDRLIDLVCASQNALFVLAGRPPERPETESSKQRPEQKRPQLWDLLCQRFGEDAKLVKLEPLETESSEQYLEQKQLQLHTTLEPDLAQKLLLLAQGRPILIDLAVEWLARNIPLKWLTTNSVEEIAGLSEEETKKRRKDFQRQLVEHIGRIRTQMDRLTLVMSRVYPLDARMIAELLYVPTDEAKELLEEAQTYVFVKSLPGERIYLHDEVRRMIRELWRDIDPGEDRRRQDSRVAMQCFEHQVEKLTQDIAQFVTTEETARQEQDAQGELNAFMARKIAEQELWAIREQQLFHTAFVDADLGLQTFIEVFDEATHAYHFAFREMLLAEMQKYVARLSPRQKYEVDIRQAKYLLDSGHYPKARELLLEMSSGTGLDPEQQIDVHIQRANVEIRLGKFQDGIKFFQEAVRISRECECGMEEWLAKAETGLGWAYRLTANLEEAGKHYQIALDLAIETGSKHQQALLYGNLGFVYTYYAHIPGNSQKALWFCKRSLSLWKELGDRRGEGRAYSTLGCVTFMAGRFDEALSYFQKALDIFEPAHDREWLSVVYSWRGAVHMSRQRFDLAEQDILHSLEMNVLKDRPINLSRLSLIYVIQQKYDKAQKAVDECRELALTLPDVWYQLISLRDMARLARHKGQYDRLDEFERSLDDYLKQYVAQDRRALGMLYLNLGSLALGQLDLDRAVDHFQRGLKPLADQGRYGSDTTEVHIERLERVMVEELRLLPEQIREIGTRLYAFWQEEGLSFTHPDVRILLSRWKKWEAS